MSRMTVAVLLIAATLVGAFGCTTTQAQGEVTRQVREVSSFDRIHLINGGRIVLVQDDEFALSVETRADALERVRTEVNDGVLELEFDSGRLWLMRTPRPLVYYITTARLSGLEISGQGRFETGSLDVDSLDIDIAGSGEIAIDALRGKTIDVDISGSGRFELGGEITTQKIAVSGSGRYEAMTLASRDVTVRISGSGRARVDASDTLDVDISGSGRVEYAGGPRVNSRITGSGSIRAAAN